MWADYFDDGSEHGTCTVHGIDINLRRFEEHRAELRAQGAFARNVIATHEQNTASDAFIKYVTSTLPGLDVVLDDGCHTAASQWRCFTLLWPMVRPGGVYIVEDIESSGDFFHGTHEATHGAFGLLLAAVANANVLSSAVVQRERTACLARAQSAVASTRERLAKNVESLEARLAASALRGDSPWLHEALSAKRVELTAADATYEAEMARAKGMARAAFDAQVAMVRQLCADVAAVEVRKMNVVFRKGGTWCDSRRQSTVCSTVTEKV